MCPEPAVFKQICVFSLAFRELFMAFFPGNNFQLRFDKRVALDRKLQ